MTAHQSEHCCTAENFGVISVNFQKPRRPDFSGFLDRGDSTTGPPSPKSMSLKSLQGPLLATRGARGTTRRRGHRNGFFGGLTGGASSMLACIASRKRRTSETAPGRRSGAVDNVDTAPRRTRPTRRFCAPQARLWHACQKCAKRAWNGAR